MSESEITQTILEVSCSELIQTSGIYDETQDRELTNWEAMQEIAHALGAYTIFQSMDGVLSEEAKQHNSSVTRSGEGDYIQAVVMRFKVSTSKD